MSDRGQKGNLETQTGKIWLVIRKNRPIDLPKFDFWVKSVFETYAYIVHDGDVSVDDGSIIPIHYHLVGNLKKKYSKRRLITTLNQCVKAIGEDNGIGIQIEEYGSLEGCVQYLTHKNIPVKTQHNKNEIIHNFSQKVFDTLYNVKLNQQIDFDYIYSKCQTCTSKLEVIRELWFYYSKSVSLQRIIDEIFKLVKGGSIL